jgi:hypothetical protein
MQSPGPSATDRFQSPVAHSSAVNRELFPSVQSSQSLLQHAHLSKFILQYCIKNRLIYVFFYLVTVKCIESVFDYSD